MYKDDFGVFLRACRYLEYNIRYDQSDGGHKINKRVVLMTRYLSNHDYGECARICLCGRDLFLISSKLHKV